MIAMGMIDPGNYLGGRVELRSDLAEDALRRFGEPMGWEVEEAAAAVHDLVVTNMANAVREVSVAHGYDPRDFVFYAYGGTLPWFAAEIARTLKIERVLIPNNSSVFCARGLLASDFVLRYDQTIQSGLDSEQALARINDVYDEMVETGREEMRREGFADDSTARSTCSSRVRSTRCRSRSPTARSPARTSPSCRPGSTRPTSAPTVPAPPGRGRFPKPSTSP
jgi:N-methylhydantoinase A